MKRNPRAVVTQSELEDALRSAGVVPAKAYAIVNQVFFGDGVVEGEAPIARYRILRIASLANQYFMAKLGAYVDVFPSKLSPSKRGVLRRLDSIILELHKTYKIPWEDCVKLYLKTFADRYKDKEGKRRTWVGSLVSDWMITAANEAAKERDRSSDKAGWWELVDRRRRTRAPLDSE